MKRLIAPIACILISLLIFIGCKKSNYKVTIKTDVKSYSLLSSSLRGITMRPEVEEEDDLNIRYHWITTDGEFLGEDNSKNKEVTNDGEPVLWAGISEDSNKPITSAKVILKIEDVSTDEVLAETMINIEGKDTIFTLIE